jgi:carboxyl-terminal processing protease
MNVKIVGKLTYGKPVGFFPVRLENKYDVYLSMFESKNSKDEGGYYAGITPDVVDRNTAALYEDATHDFGDADESYLKNAIALLAPAAAGKSSNVIMSIRGKQVSVASSLNIKNESKTAKQFVGMIETRHKLKENR